MDHQRLAEMRGEQHVDPRVHLEPPRAGARDQALQRVELLRLPLEQRAPRRERRVVEGIPPPPNLHEEGVQAPLLGLVDDAIDGLGRDESGADDPQPAKLALGERSAARRRGNGQGERDAREETSEHEK